MDQIRPLTALSRDELIARIEQYEEVLQLRDAEIRELHAAVDTLREQEEAIGAGGVSGQRITGQADV